MSARWSFLARVPAGLERLAAQEIRALGGGVGETRTGPGQVSFRGPPDALYRANLGLRIADRVLLPLVDTTLRSFPAMKQSIAELPWEEFLGPGLALDVVVRTRGCTLFHSGAIEDCVREGVAKRGLKVPEHEDEARVTVDLRGTQDVFTVSVDSSGRGLGRRGYRTRGSLAPLKENLAAAVLSLAGYQGKRPLHDPMCGSGTLVIEAAHRAQRRAPGLGRRFAFEHFPGFDSQRWTELQEKARERCDPSGGGALVRGSDSESNPLADARDNSRRAGTVGLARFDRCALEDLVPDDSGPGLVVLNPPYGRRLGGDEARQIETWKAWGDLLRAKHPGWEIVTLAPDRELAAAMGATGRPLARFLNGGIRVEVWRIG